jgi:hypothetical protein
MAGPRASIRRRRQAARDFTPQEVHLLSPSAHLETTQLESKVVFEDPGKIRLVDGFECAAADGKAIWLYGKSLGLPDYATQATLFLRGWNLKYLGGDHHAKGLASIIYNLRVENQALMWDAYGTLHDGNSDDPFEWCYYWTAVAWNGEVIDAVVDHDDGGDLQKKTNVTSSSLVEDNETALVILPSYIHNPVAFRGKQAVVILPRGFQMDWRNDDHHLLQLAYNLDHNEPFIENGKQYGRLPDPPLPDTASSIDSGFVSWETHGILKDNRAKRDYAFVEHFSALAGDAVGMIQSPFSIRPKEDAGLFEGCITTPSGLKTEEYVIRNVPFDYAIPVLAGWELDYGCEDHHIREIGIRLHDMEYDKPLGASTGTLRYQLSSILTDDSGNGHTFRHKVHILGLNSSGIGTQPKP